MQVRVRNDIEELVPCIGRPPKYRWDEFFDGRVYQISPSDLDVPMQGWIDQARRAARSKGYRLVTRSIEGGRLIQAIER